MIPRLSPYPSAEAVEEAFYDAMQKGDLAALMALWADDEEVVCVHPNGQRLVGLEAVRTSFENIFGAGSIAVHVRSVRSHAGALIAVHNLIEQIRIEGRGGSSTVECVATNVYVKGPYGWRILVHHASPHESGDPAASAPVGAILH